MLKKILEYNKEFVKNKGYEPFMTSKYPDRQLAIVTCMDTRLTELLPSALGLKNGDAKIIKNAGGVISHPFGSAVRSLLIAIYELGVKDIMVVGHTDCGVQHMDSHVMIEEMKKRGIRNGALDMMSYFGIDFEEWMSGFDDVFDSVRSSVDLLKKHPLIPDDVKIYGYVMDSVTGALMEA